MGPFEVGSNQDSIIRLQASNGVVPLIGNICSIEVSGVGRGLGARRHTNPDRLKGGILDNIHMPYSTH